MFDACAGATKFFTIYIPHIYCYESFCTTSLVAKEGLIGSNASTAQQTWGLQSGFLRGNWYFFLLSLLLLRSSHRTFIGGGSMA